MSGYSPRRIAFFIPTLAQGGGERVVSVLSSHMPSTVSCSLIVFEKKISYPFSGEIISLEVPLSLHPVRRAWRFFVRMRRFSSVLREHSFDAVVSVGFAPNLMNVLVNREKAVLRADLPLSWSTPGFWGFLYRMAGRLFFPRARCIVAVSRLIQEDLEKSFGVLASAIRVIPNPIDTQEIQRLKEEPVTLQPTVITMGRLTHQKGQSHLLRAFRQVRKEIPDATLAILGEGELRQELEGLRHALGLDDAVEFLGWRKNPFAFLGRAQLFVLSSFWEGLPDVLLEAMACGLPVVSSDCRSGPREILAPSSDFRTQADGEEEAEYGILVPPPSGVGEEEMLAFAMVRMLKDANMRKTFESKGRERALQYDVKAVIPQWSFLWESASSSCPVCEVPASLVFIRKYSKNQEQFSLYECSECRVQFWMPFHNPGGQWYEQQAGNVIQEALAPAIQREYHKKILSLPDRELKGKRVLDVGCGTGEFLAALQERGCEVWGVDFDHIAVGVAKNHFRLEHVFACSLEEFFKNASLPRFDIITCFEVIEHVDKPLRLLSHIRGAVASHGRVFLSTPSRDRMAADANVWDYPPNHLTRWSKEALANVAQRAGFVIKDISYGDQFRILLESMQGGFHTGLVKKAAMSSGSRRFRSFKTGVIRSLGVFKAYLLGVVPASAFWCYGKLTKRKNGTMIAELRLS